jgi:pyruvate dehydrogenase E1 component alpha subunit
MSLDGRGGVTVTTFGDGATAGGSYHESLNLASLWKLPVVFVCQNNQWAEHTALADYAPSTDLAGRAAAYALRSEAVDGFDAVETWRTLNRAIEGARAGEGPAFVECRTYRLTGHSATADISYVPKDELEAAQKRDPVPAFRKWLVANGVVSEGRLDEIDKAALEEVADAFEYGYSSPPTPADELYVDVFATSLGGVTR